MSRILVGSTIPAFAMTTPDWHWWLHNWSAITRQASQNGHEVEWLAVCQEDARGRDIFRPLLQTLDGVQSFEADQYVDLASVRWFSLDSGEKEVTSSNRLTGIVTGRNLIIDHAIRHGHDYIYFADSDIEAPDDILVRLLEIQHEVVGAHVPTYCLSGPECLPNVQEHWNTAGSLLVHRDVFRRVPWRIDPDAGDTDDPATQKEMERLGYPTLVRHDVLCGHHPESIGGFEGRGIDRKVYR